MPIYAFIITNPTRTPDVRLVKDNSLEAAILTLRAEAEKNYPLGWRADYVNAITEDELLSSLNISTIKVAETAPVDVPKTKIENLERYAELLRENGYSVKKKP